MSSEEEVLALQVVEGDDDDEGETCWSNASCVSYVSGGKSGGVAFPSDWKLHFLLVAESIGYQAFFS